MFKKILIIFFLFIFLAGTAHSAWWAIVHLNWKDTGGPYQVVVRFERDTGYVGEYEFTTNNNYQQIDVEPNAVLHWIRVYSAGQLTAETIFKSHPVVELDRVIKF